MDLINAPWHKSSYSPTSNANCVEVAEVPEATAVRDTQHRQLGALVFGHEQWVALTTAVRARA